MLEEGSARCRRRKKPRSLSLIGRRRGSVEHDSIFVDECQQCRSRWEAAVIASYPQVWKLCYTGMGGLRPLHLLSTACVQDIDR